MAGLIDSGYLRFPFDIDAASGNPAVSGRAAHIREQIEQVLFTNPGERLFRPEFGVGIRHMVFEPNSQALWGIVSRQLGAALTDVLFGEVDPRTLEVDVSGDGEQLVVRVAYTLAAINRQESHTFAIGSGGSGG
ncbi:MAG TPA: GPW/gp25 family protein [Mariprofundaceae bacterium]|nr:GPW/gp25 family protein [Mariprofundaceae bacterium]